MASYGEVLVGTIPEGAFLLDVREDDEWAAGHAPEATHVVLSTLPQHLASMPSDQTIAVICKAGGRSAQAADYLAQQGYQALNIKGGMLAWARAGKPMVAEGDRDPIVL
jgi:rhodanese-related sulfurtransferase